MIPTARAIAVCFVLFLCASGLSAVTALIADERRPSGESVFRTVLRRQGDDKVHTYRIPGLVTTPKGTLIAVFDVRYKNAGDLPGDIDVGMMRSTDDGKTWSSMRIILDFDKEEKNALGNGVGDPAVVVDRRTGRILVVGLWSKGNRAWSGSGPGLAPEETGQVVLTRSEDDGLAWSKQINITQKITGRDKGWRLCFQGPGSGIQLRDGTLVLAAQFRDDAGTPHSCILSSANGGETWTISSPAIPTRPPTSESQVAELKDGSLLLTMRDESRSGKRAWARYEWNEELSKGRWSAPWFAVSDPTCMASIVSHPKGLLLLSNPNSERERKALTIRTSTDDGKSWSAGRLLDPRPCAYSCLTVLRDGSIGVLYEAGEKGSYETLTFARFSLDWVLSK